MVASILSKTNNFQKDLFDGDLEVTTILDLSGPGVI